MTKKKEFVQKPIETKLSKIDIELSQKEVSKREIIDRTFKSYALFQDNLLKIYQDLHPQDSEAQMEDIHNETVTTILTRFPSNDLSFSVRDEHLILIENQTTWSRHMGLRLYVYSALVLLSYIIRTNGDISNLSEKWKPPAIELIVLYTGKPRKLPEEISYFQEFFSEEETDINIRFHIISQEDRTTLGQFNAFGNQLREVRKRHPDNPYSAAVIEETVMACLEKDIMTEFLTSERVVFERMLIDLFSIESEIEALTRQRQAQAQEKEDKAVKKAVKEAVKEAEDKTNKKWILDLFKQGILSQEEAEIKAQELGISLDLKN